MEDIDPALRTIEQNRWQHERDSQSQSHHHYYASSYIPLSPFHPTYYDGGAPYLSSFRYHPNAVPYPYSRFMPRADPEYKPPHHHFEWPFSPAEYITEIKPNDGRWHRRCHALLAGDQKVVFLTCDSQYSVLSGRGGATNAHNRAFRSTIKKYQKDYLKAKKRDKPKVAVAIVQKIRELGGRFLRRHDVTGQGGVVWVDIGDTRAVEKVCQALREGAPEIRRQKEADASPRGPYNYHQRFTNSDGTLSAASSLDRTVSIGDEAPHKGRTQILRSSFQQEMEEATAACGTIVIRPSPNLIRQSSAIRNDIAMQVDHLDPHDREAYLRYFIPPNPAIPKKQRNSLALLTPDGARGGFADASVPADRAHQPVLV
jgi:hypothetical protein